MKFLPLLFVSLCFFHCHSKKEEPTVEKNIEGEYEGIRTFFQVNNGQTTSLASARVSLTISKNTSSGIDIKGMSSVDQTVNALLHTSSSFSYNRGKGLSDCGVTDMTGEGYFSNDSLFITDYIQCASQELSPLSQKFTIKAVRKPN
jgi:hypothetical protein